LGILGIVGVDAGSDISKTIIIVYPMMPLPSFRSSKIAASRAARKSQSCQPQYSGNGISVMRLTNQIEQAIVCHDGLKK
jgi:hypothetical protein